MKLQQLNAAAQPSAALSHASQDILRRYGLADGAKDTPLGGSVDIAADIFGQPVPEVTIDEFSVALKHAHDPWSASVPFKMQTPMGTSVCT